MSIMLQKIITPDGSITFYNPDFDEAYHSKSGAKEEAMKKFIEPCQIKELAKKGHIKLLDVCFGLGYNTAAAIDVALQENPSCSVEVVGLEKDKTILQEIPALDNSFACYGMLKECIQNGYSYNKQNIQIKIILGDALETIKQVTGEFDAVFFDPFSPKKCSALWSGELFCDIYQRMRKESRLATYSCARIVRDNLKSVGFAVLDGPKLWRRGPSTIGVKR